MFKDWVGAFCLSGREFYLVILKFTKIEAGSGSDAFSLKTLAKPDGDDFLITGNKLWISNAKEAKFFLVKI